MIGTIINFIKLFFALLLMPIVFFLTRGFFEQIRALGDLSHYFLWGGGVYVLFHLFFRPMQALHGFGQKVFSEILRVTPFLANYLPMAVPITPTVLVLILYVIQTFTDPGPLSHYFLFAVGFTLAMHIIINARLLYEEDNTALRAHYLFLECLFYVLNILIIVILLQLIFPAFHVGHLIRHVMIDVGQVYEKVSHFLFQARPQI